MQINKYFMKTKKKNLINSKKINKKKIKVMTTTKFLLIYKFFFN